LAGGREVELTKADVERRKEWKFGTFTKKSLRK
jgi:hypothetical protein